MKMQHQGLIAMTLLAAFCCAQAGAETLPKANVHYIRAADLGNANSRVATNSAGVVRKRAGYGQGYVYGRNVNNQLGSILIWDAAPTSKYGKSPSMQNRNNGHRLAGNALGPKLTYKPGYGKTTSTNDSR
jgi:cytochrome c2